MPSQQTTYVLGGVFVVLITVIGMLVSRTLLKQDQVVSFEAPMHEFIDTLERELAYNAYALNSLAQLFRSSERVEAHEFASYTGLLMKQFGNIVAMTYLAKPEDALSNIPLAQVYWQDADKAAAFNSSAILASANIVTLQKRVLDTRKAAASPIFQQQNDDNYYAFVLLQVAELQGFVGALIDASFTLDQTLNNQINKGYTLFEKYTGSPQLVFSRNLASREQPVQITDGDFTGTLTFFDRQWLVSTYQTASLHRKVAFEAISVGSFLLSTLIVYLIIQGQRLQSVNREKQRAYEDLKFAQKKLVKSEKLAAMGGLVAGVAHEVNTPLGIGVTSMSHLQEIMNELRNEYEQGRLNSEQFKEFLEAGDEMVGLSLNNLRKASALVTKFKKVDVISAESESSPEPVNIANLVNTFTARFHNENPGSRVKITANINPSITLNTYPAVLLDILGYLGSNAVVHGFKPEQKECEITITFPYKGKSNQNNVLQFKDNGVGVEKALLKRIVDPFFTTRRGAGYSGLGLSVVYNLVIGKLNSDLNLYVDEGLALTFQLHDLDK